MRFVEVQALYDGDKHWATDLKRRICYSNFRYKSLLCQMLTDEVSGEFVNGVETRLSLKILIVIKLNSETRFIT